MLSDIRNCYGLTRELSLTGQSTYFETTQSQHVVKELKLAIKDGNPFISSGRSATRARRCIANARTHGCADPDWTRAASTKARCSWSMRSALTPRRFA